MPAPTRTAGLLLAVILLVVFAGLVTFFVVRSPSGTPTQNTFSGPAPVPDPALVPTADGPANRAGAGQGFYVQIVDKDDPTAVRAELAAERSRPIEGQTYRVALEKPVIWVFLKDGRTIYARADQGTAYIPDQSKGLGARPSMPQDGVMEGNVVVKIFEAREGNLRPNPAEDDAVVQGTTQVVRFDSELGQVEAPERVKITSAGVAFQGSGVTVIFNEPQQRLELLHVAHTDEVAINPAEFERERERREQRKKKAPAAPPTAKKIAESSAKPAGGPATGGAVGAAKEQPVETLYRMVCSEKVTVTQGTRTITSEQLEAWARLIDNELRPGAIVTSNAGAKTAASPEPKPGSTAGTKAGAGGKAEVAAAAPQPASDNPLAADSSTPVTLTWKGPLEVRPLTQKPAELNLNELFVRFTSKADTGVAFNDSKAKATARGNLLEYGATRREVALGGKGPKGATIVVADAGHAAAERFDMSLVTGAARVSGAGVVTGLAKAAAGGEREPDRTLAWKNEAQFQFQRDAEGEVTQVLTKVDAHGDVRASDGRSALAGQKLVAALLPVNDQRSRLHALTIIGKAHAEDGRGGSLDADKLDVSFVPTPNKPEESDPRLVVATGAVKGQKQENSKTATLNASRLEAAIGRVREDSGKEVLTATNIKATETTFTHSDGLRAAAPVLTADPVAGVARLTGTGNSVMVGNAESTITGQDMTFHDAERRLLAAGPGTLTHETGQTAEKPAERLAASWTRELTFDDVQGLATIKGDAVAEHSRLRDGAVLARDTMKAEDVLLVLTPGSSAPGGGHQSPDDRKLLRAMITGTLETRAGGTPASIESRLYGAAQAGQPPALERLMYLESARIAADDEKGTLDVPKAGKLLFVDRRAAADAAKAGADQLLDNPENARGTALFTWTGAMNLDRPAGLVTLRENVRLTHQRTGDPERSELECETLTAKVREDTSGTKAAAPGSFEGELISADARGAVWMRYAGRELVADRAKYDAVKRTLHAQAMGENTVQMFGPNSPTSSAKELLWDLATDRIDITKPGPITTPR